VLVRVVEVAEKNAFVDVGSSGRMIVTGSGLVAELGARQHPDLAAEPHLQRLRRAPEDFVSGKHFEQFVVSQVSQGREMIAADLGGDLVEASG
jgi:hypothetical protein